VHSRGATADVHSDDDGNGNERMISGHSLLLLCIVLNRRRSRRVRLADTGLNSKNSNKDERAHDRRIVRSGAESLSDSSLDGTVDPVALQRERRCWHRGCSETDGLARERCNGRRRQWHGNESCSGGGERARLCVL